MSVRFVAFCGALLCSASAHASVHRINWINSDESRTATVLEVCQGINCVDMDVSCAPGEQCSSDVDLIPGLWPTSIRVAEFRSGEWSDKSNEISIRVQMNPADCLAVNTCRFDVDGDGIVAGTDFNAFVNAFGGTWP